jgi:hypothetical protein
MHTRTPLALESAPDTGWAPTGTAHHAMHEITAATQRNH